MYSYSPAALSGSPAVYSDSLAAHLEGYVVRMNIPVVVVARPPVARIVVVIGVTAAVMMAAWKSYFYLCCACLQTASANSTVAVCCVEHSFSVELLADGGNYLVMQKQS